jgi:hypothetical protein
MAAPIGNMPMKKFINSLAFALTLTGTLVTAADKPTREDAQARLQEIGNQLQLTDDQKARITPILQQEAADLKALRDNTALKGRYKLRRAQSIAETASQQVRALLTSEQQPKYDALRAEQKAKRKEQFKERMKERNADDPAAAS